jgi:HD-GYP domain-containing protein (c-di-GMP phosphodiesterase class II)
MCLLCHTCRKWLNLDRDSIRTAVKAGLLHDIGKMKIPVEILNKKARLSDEDSR